MERSAYRRNDANRCYHCKTELFEVLGALRDEIGFDAVAYGVNTEDMGDFRPGHRAASEHGVLSPFLDADLSKAEIRALSRAAGLPSAELPASACLSSRLPYGTEVTPERLRQVDEGEERLRALGFEQVRLRHHGPLARVEIAPDELRRALEPAMAARIVAAFHEGFPEPMGPPGEREASDAGHDTHIARVLGSVDPLPLREQGFRVLLDSINGAG